MSIKPLPAKEALEDGAFLIGCIPPEWTAERLLRACATVETLVRMSPPQGLGQVAAAPPPADGAPMQLVLPGAGVPVQRAGYMVCPSQQCRKQVKRKIDGTPYPHYRALGEPCEAAPRGGKPEPPALAGLQPTLETVLPATH